MIDIINDIKEREQRFTYEEQNRLKAIGIRHQFSIDMFRNKAINKSYSERLGVETLGQLYDKLKE